jgi:ADP-ribose pyrophosphatase YjhB (NUDIX family)
MQPEQVFSSYPVRGVSERLRFGWCPRCGRRLGSGAGERRCANCGFTDYKNPLPGVVVLIEEQDRVLLGRRGPRSFEAGRWCLPGGFIEYAEDFLTAAVREVREETGLRVEILSLLSVVSNFLAEELHTLVVVLLGKVAGGQARAGDDLEELAWFPLQGPLPPMAFQADRHIVERYRATRLAGAPVDPRYAGSRIQPSAGSPSF